MAGSISGIAGALNGVGLNSTFNGPRLLDNDGVDLFIPDGSGATVRRLNPRTSEVTTVIGEEKECVRVDGLLSVARTCQPYWVLRTEDGIFLIDSAGFSIRWVH